MLGECRKRERETFITELGEGRKTTLNERGTPVRGAARRRDTSVTKVTSHYLLVYLLVPPVCHGCSGLRLLIFASCVGECTGCVARGGEDKALRAIVRCGGVSRRSRCTWRPPPPPKPLRAGRSMHAESCLTTETPRRALSFPIVGSPGPRFCR